MTSGGFNVFRKFFNFFIRNESRPSHLPNREPKVIICWVFKIRSGSLFVDESQIPEEFRVAERFTSGNTLSGGEMKPERRSKRGVSAGMGLPTPASAKADGTYPLGTEKGGQRSAWCSYESLQQWARRMTTMSCQHWELAHAHLYTKRQKPRPADRLLLCGNRKSAADS